MREKLIRDGVATLTKSFGKPRPKVSRGPLVKLHAGQEYELLVGAVASTMHVHCKITLAKVNSGGPDNARAWIGIPSPTPIYGTREFADMRVILHLRKIYLETAPADTLVASIAHEFAHVVLNSMHHSRHKEEEIVDLTAMHLGFREVFLLGIEKIDLGPLGQHMGAENKVGGRGYLTIEELRYANALMNYAELE